MSTKRSCVKLAEASFSMPRGQPANPNAGDAERGGPRFGELRHQPAPGSNSHRLTGPAKDQQLAPGGDLDPLPLRRDALRGPDSHRLPSLRLKCLHVVLGQRSVPPLLLHLIRHQRQQQGVSSCLDAAHTLHPASMESPLQQDAAA